MNCFFMNSTTASALIRTGIVGFIPAILFFGASTVNADTLGNVSLSFNQLYIQTSNSAPSTAPSYFFGANSATNAGGGSPVFTSASLTGPFPGSPQAMTVNSGGFSYQTGLMASLNSFGAGSYTISGTRADSTTQSASIAYGGTQYYTSTTPYISDYSSLAGLNPTQAFTFDFSAFTPNPNADSEAYTFLNIYNTTTGMSVFSQNFLPDTTTSVTVPGGSLMANTEYTFDLIYDNRIDGTNSGVATYQLFDNRTDGTFTTGLGVVATPEPASAGMMVAGALSLLLFARRRERA